MDTQEAGAKGGRSRSAAKRAASARNLEKARTARRATAAPVKPAPQPATTRPVLLVVK